MNDDNELDPVARLRAADPAAGVEPRPGFTDDVIAQSTSAQSTAEMPDAAAERSAAAVTDLGAERARRRPRWLAIAAVAASVAVVGGAGFGIGSLTAGSAEVAAPPISLQTGVTHDGAAQESAAFDTADRKMAGGSVSDMMMPYGSGRNVFSASGLSSDGGAATAYAYDARAASNAETVAALAASLGVEGTPVLENGSWTVGPQDGSGPSLFVGLDGTLGFSYSNPGINPWNCGPVAIEPATPDDGAIPEMQTCEPPVADLPSEGAAIDALRSVITAAGRDAEAFEYTSETWEGAVTRMAQGWPVVDGQRIDQAWSVELSNEGLVSASGALADLVTLGDYDVVSEQEGFERLSDPRFGAQMTAMPLAVADSSTGLMTEEWTPPTEPPSTPAAGSSVSWPVNDVQIVGARLGLSSQWQPDGSVLVVPAYEFTDADGGTWSVIAVADAHLDFATE